MLFSRCASEPSISTPCLFFLLYKFQVLRKAKERVGKLILLSLKILAMEPSTLVAALCVAVSFMLASCASDQVNVQESEQQYGNSVAQQPQTTLPSLPRKLKLQEEVDVKRSTDKDIMLQKKLLEASAGKKGGVQINVAATRGTWREWVESPNKSEYFTMDYAWIRRRRPIHNKQIPFVP